MKDTTMNKNTETDQSKRAASRGAPWLGGIFASQIARDIMEMGNFPTPCQRIQFMGGTYPDDELPQGGLCEAALVKRIEATLRVLMPPNDKLCREAGQKTHDEH